jgi:hypothetical protein
LPPPGTSTGVAAVDADIEHARSLGAKRQAAIAAFVALRDGRPAAKAADLDAGVEAARTGAADPGPKNVKRHQDALDRAVRAKEVAAAAVATEAAALWKLYVANQPALIAATTDAEIAERSLLDAALAEVRARLASHTAARNLAVWARELVDYPDYKGGQRTVVLPGGVTVRPDELLDLLAPPAA